MTTGLDAMAPQRPSILRFVLLALAVPVILGAVSSWLGSEYATIEKMRLQARTSFDREIQTIMLVARIVDAESSQRGFVITGYLPFLNGYVRARDEVMRAFEKLQRTRAGVSDQERLRAELRGLAVRQFAKMDRVAAVRRDQGLEAAVRLVQATRGRSLMDEMRAVSARMLALAERERAARVDAYRRRVDVDRLYMWIAIMVVGLLLLAAAIMLWRQSNARYLLRLAAHGVAERNRSILDSTIDAIVIVNPDGTIETINAAASAMLGYRPEELEHRDVSVLVPRSAGSTAFHEQIGLLDGRLANRYLSDCKIVHRDGHEIPVDIALGIMRPPDGDHIVASVRDISDRKRIDRMKDELLSTVNHELRTPLTAVIGALGLLRAGTAGTIPPSATRLIEITENNSRRLIRLINDMLDIDRIQSARLHLERHPIDLREVVTQACGEGRGLATAAGVKMACMVPESVVTVAGDADRLLQVITNLVSNAVRVSPPGGVVTIGLTTAPAGSALVTVDDEGRGVPMEFRGRIFGRFERAEGERGAGSGLGLAISREIVDRHEGSLWFEDRPQGGTRFAFTLDVVRDREADLYAMEARQS
ncbi:ATP-binding protein [uncultured Sphingomonas sp.]|uniref:sensor histidine kinase n=1 Tax=uncultured Sphingomonas sp. TaxID=158754 RepID=UPI0035CA815C